jgi:putative ABC transport system permease protein
MISSRWYKVFNDLWNNKTRTVLIVLSIAVGLFAVGTIASARTILATGMARSYAAINPSSGVVHTVETFDEDFVQSVRAMKGVEDADARRVIDVRLQLGPGEWGDLRIYAVADYDDMRVNIIRPQSGAWPPPEREILIERAALEMVRAQVGDVILVEMPNEKRRELRIAGTVHDMALMPAQFENMPYGYISFETLKWLSEPHGFNELYVVAEDRNDKKLAQRVVNRVKDRVEKMGFTIPLSMTSEPGQVPLDDILQAILLLLGVLGLLSLFLSLFLIVNTISALLAQQKRQIGVMKAIGARSSQVIGMYLAMVTAYGLAALVIAVPLGIVGSRELSRFMASMFNFDLTNLGTPPQAVALQIAVGLLVPLLASLYPLVSSLRITAAEAMSSYRMGEGSGGNFLDRLLSGANLWFARRVLPRPLLLSLRNTFRSKGRLALTLITLTLSGAIFISVFSVRASLLRTLDDLLMWWNFDTSIVFERPYRVEKIEREARRVPGAVQVDTWLQMPVRRVRKDGSESDPIYFYALRADSDLVPSPVIVQGRWLLPEDENALVVSTILLDDEPDINLGDEVVLKIKGRERAFRVVGACLGLSSTAYANYPYVARITGSVGRAGVALVATEQREEEAVVKTTTALEDHFKRVGLRVSGEQIAASERSSREAAFGILVSLLLIMAVLLALVGGLGLMGTMSINVLERTREIGVLRAIGAPNRGVAWVFIREGVAIGLLSWLLGSLLAIPLSRLLSDAVGIPILGVPLSFSFSTIGVWVWLVVVIALSALASFLPARSASRLTVREVLAYE